MRPLLLLTASLAAAAGAAAGCSSSSDATTLRLPGIATGPCDSTLKALFGRVPLRFVADGPITSLRVTVGSAEPMVVDKAPYQVELDTTKLPDGTVKVVARADDATLDLDICIDNHGPELTVLSPAENAAVGIEDNALRVRVRAVDPSGVESIRAVLGVPGARQQRDCQPKTGPDATCVMDPGALGLAFADAGSATISLRVVARDAHGRESADERQLKVGTRLLWRYQAGAAISWAVAPLPGGNVAVGSDAGNVDVIDANGQRICRWSSTPVNGQPDGVASRLSASADGSRLYFTTTTRLCAVNAATCAQVWCLGGGLYFGSQPALDEARSLLFVGRYGETGSEGTLRAHALADGQQRGTIPVTDVSNGAVTSSPTLSPDGNTVYIGSSNFDLYAIDVSNPAAMSARWRARTGDKLETKALVVGTRVYISGRDSRLHAFDAATGAPVAAFSFQAKAPFLSSVIASSSGTLYVGSLDEKLYALSAEGKVLAEFENGRMLNTTPAIGPGDIIYAARTRPTRLQALDAQLQPLWSLTPSQREDDELRASPVVHNNVVYIGATNGLLYALDAKPSP
ncbi:MAG: PQQ-binding-like beta-propeller repeat protein [Myxococcales bacterium]|nr:PQQ-binding-like beta-propeller repeat protein [Myxococcales bacterium]